VLVDDERMILDMLQARLDKVEDIEVVGTALSGRVALRLVETHQPDAGHEARRYLSGAAGGRSVAP
jgi:YesN/AraC family two-component response regulator